MRAHIPLFYVLCFAHISINFENVDAAWAEHVSGDVPSHILPLLDEATSDPGVTQLPF